MSQASKFFLSKKLKNFFALGHGLSSLAGDFALLSLLLTTSQGFLIPKFYKLDHLIRDQPPFAFSFLFINTEIGI